MAMSEKWKKEAIRQVENTAVNKQIARNCFVATILNHTMERPGGKMFILSIGADEYEKALGRAFDKWMAEGRK